MVANITTKVIVPIITYSLEAERMDEGNYTAIDATLVKCLTPLGLMEEESSPLWTCFEHGIPPPSLIVQRNKLLAAHKCADVRTLLHHILRGLEQMSLKGETTLWQQELEAIKLEWGIEEVWGRLTENPSRYQAKATIKLQRFPSTSVLAQHSNIRCILPGTSSGNTF